MVELDLMFDGVSRDDRTPVEIPTIRGAVQILETETLRWTVFCQVRKVLRNRPAYFHHQALSSKLPETGMQLVTTACSQNHKTLVALECNYPYPAVMRPPA